MSIPYSSISPCRIQEKQREGGHQAGSPEAQAAIEKIKRKNMKKGRVEFSLGGSRIPKK